MALKEILPLIPGSGANHCLGRTNFHRSQIFEYIHGCPMPTDKEKAAIGKFPLEGTRQSQKYPSVYPKDESVKIPGWLAFNRQNLCFEAYFQETAQERNGYALQVRRCKIYFYLEDGSIQVIEPRVENSGIPQGTLIARQRIPFPAPRHYEFYDILDFNVGLTVELFGRIFKITNCDDFTRTFLNRVGISVPDPIPVPCDPYMKIREFESTAMCARRPNRFVDTRGQFLAHDRHVLRFCGFWDNRCQPYGIVHHLALHYFLSDSTVEITEYIPPNSGRDQKTMFLSRCKLPKFSTAPWEPGDLNPFSVLNVMSTGFLGGRYIIDPLNSGFTPKPCYTDRDLFIGACVNVYGRKVILTHCDENTQEYYRQKYGIEDFTPYPTPEEPPVCVPYEPPPLPPYNGWGTFDDSAGNCRKMIPDLPKIDFVKFFEKDRIGLDSHILRFQARMVSNIPENNDRIFIISFHLSDDTISVFERACHNAGFQGGSFFSRSKMYKPGQQIFQSKEPEWYKVEDMYLGNVICLNDYMFRLEDADEYALRYLELNSNELPLADVSETLKKLRSYDLSEEVFNKYIVKGQGDNIPEGVIKYCDLKKALCEITEGTISDHEVVNLARRYSVVYNKEEIDKETLRAITHTELQRFLYYDLERLTECFYQLDRERTGFVSQDRAYALCRGARIPMDKTMLRAILKEMPQNERNEISYPDLIQFMDYKKYPCYHAAPVNQRVTFGVNEGCPTPFVGYVNLTKLLEDINCAPVSLEK